jgi:hypothetical protein
MASDIGFTSGRGSCGVILAKGTLIYSFNKRFMLSSKLSLKGSGKRELSSQATET